MKTFLGLLCIVAAIHAECDQPKSYHTYNLWQGPSGAQLVLYGPPVLLVPWPAIMWQMTVPGCPSTAPQGKQDGQQYPCGLQWRLQEQRGRQGDNKDIVKLSNSDGGKPDEYKSSEEQTNGIKYQNNETPGKIEVQKPAQPALPNKEENGEKRSNPADIGSGESQSSEEHLSYPTRPKGNLQPKGIEWYLQNEQHKTSKPHGDVQLQQNRMSLNQENDGDTDSNGTHSTESDEQDGVSTKNPAHDESAESRSSEGTNSSPKNQKGEKQHKGKWFIKNEQQKISKTQGDIYQPQNQMSLNQQNNSDSDSDETHSTESSAEDESDESRSSEGQLLSKPRPKGKKKQKSIKWSVKHKQQKTSTNQHEILIPAQQKTPSYEENEKESSGETHSSERDEQDGAKRLNSADIGSGESQSSEEHLSYPKRPKGNLKHKGAEWHIQNEQQNTSKTHGDIHKPQNQMSLNQQNDSDSDSDETHSTESSAEDESEESKSSEGQQLSKTRAKGKKKQKSIKWSVKHKQQKTSTNQHEILIPAQQKTPSYEENEKESSGETHSSERDEQDGAKRLNPADIGSDKSQSSEEHLPYPKRPKGNLQHKGAEWHIQNEQQNTSKTHGDIHEPQNHMSLNQQNDSDSDSDETHSTESSAEDESEESKSSEEQLLSKTRPKGKKKKKSIKWSIKHEQQKTSTNEHEILIPAQQKTPSYEENEKESSGETHSSERDEQDGAKRLNPADIGSGESQSSEEHLPYPKRPKGNLQHSGAEWHIQNEQQNTSETHEGILKPQNHMSLIQQNDSDSDSDETHSTESSAEDESKESKSLEEQQLSKSRSKGMKKQKSIKWSIKHKQQKTSTTQHEILIPAQQKTPSYEENEKESSGETHSSERDEQDGAKRLNPADIGSGESQSSEEHLSYPKRPKGNLKHKGAEWHIQNEQQNTSKTHGDIHKPQNQMSLNQQNDSDSDSDETRSTESSAEDESKESKSSEEQHLSKTRPKGKKNQKNIKWSIKQKQQKTSTTQQKTPSYEENEKECSGETHSSERDEQDGAKRMNPSDIGSGESRSSEEHLPYPKQPKGNLQHKGAEWHIQHEKQKTSKTHGDIHKPQNQMSLNQQNDSDSDSDETHSTESSAEDEPEESKSSEEQHLSKTRPKGKKKQKNIKWSIKQKQQKTSTTQHEILKPAQQKTPEDEKYANEGSDDAQSLESSADEESEELSEEQNLLSTRPKGKKQQKGIKWFIKHKQQKTSTAQNDIQKQVQQMIQQNEEENEGSDETDPSESDEQDDAKPRNSTDEESDESQSSEEQHSSKSQEGKKERKGNKPRKTSTTNSETPKPGKQMTLNDKENDNEGLEEAHSKSSDSETSKPTEENPVSATDKRNQKQHKGNNLYFQHIEQSEIQKPAKHKTSNNEENDSRQPSEKYTTLSSNPIDDGSNALERSAEHGTIPASGIGSKIHWFFRSLLGEITSLNRSQEREETNNLPETSQTEDEPHKYSSLEYEEHDETRQNSDQHELDNHGQIVQWHLNKKQRQEKSKVKQPSTVQPSAIPAEGTSHDTSSSESEEGHTTTTSQQNERQIQGDQGAVVQWLWNKKQRKQLSTVNPSTTPTEDTSEDTSSSESEEDHTSTTPQQTQKQGQGNQGGVVQWLWNKKQRQQLSTVNPSTSSTEATSGDTSSSESEENQTTTTPQQTEQQDQGHQGGVVQWLWNKNQRQQLSTVNPSKTPTEDTSEDTSSSESEENHTTTTPQQTEQLDKGNQGGVIQWLWNKKQRQQLSAVNPSKTPTEDTSEETSPSESEVNHVTTTPQETKQQDQGNQGGVVQWLWNKNQRQQLSAVNSPTTPTEDTSEETSTSESEESQTTTTPQQSEQQDQGDQGGVTQWLWNKKQRQQLPTVNPSTTPTEDTSEDTSSSESEENHTTTTPQQTEQLDKGNQGGVIQWLWNKKQRHQLSAVNPSKTPTEDTSEETSPSESEVNHVTTTPQETKQQDQGNQGGVVQWLWNKNQRQQLSAVNPPTTPTEDTSEETSTSESEESQTTTTPQQSEQQDQGDQGGVTQWLWNKKQRQQLPTVNPSTTPTEDTSEDTSSSESEENHTTTPQQTEQQDKGNQGGVVQWLWNKNQRQQLPTVNPSKTPTEDTSEETSPSESEVNHVTTTPQQTKQQDQGTQGGVVQWLWNKNQRQQLSAVNPPTTPTEDTSEETSTSESEESQTTTTPQQSEQQDQGDQGGVTQWLWNKKQRQQLSTVNPSTTPTEETSEDTSSSESEENHTTTTPQQTEQLDKGNQGGVIQWLWNKKQRQQLSAVNPSKTPTEDTSEETSSSESEENHVTTTPQQTEQQDQGNQGGVVQWLWNKNQRQQLPAVNPSKTPTEDTLEETSTAEIEESQTTTTPQQTEQQDQGDQGGVVQWLWNKNQPQQLSTVNPSTTPTEDTKEDTPSSESEENHTTTPQQTEQQDKGTQGGVVRWLWNKNQRQQPPAVNPPKTPTEDTSEETSTSESEESQTTTTPQQTEQHDQGDQGGVVHWLWNKNQRQQLPAVNPSTTPTEDPSEETSTSESEVSQTTTTPQQTEQQDQGDQRGVMQWLWNKKQRQQLSTVNPSTTPTEDTSEETSTSESEESPTTTTPQQTEQHDQGDKGGVVQWLWNKKQRQQLSKENPSTTPTDDTSEDTSSLEREEDHTNTTPQQTEQQDLGNQGGVVQWLWNKKQRQQLSTANPSTTPTEDTSEDTSSSESEEDHTTTTPQQTDQQDQGNQGGVVQRLWNKKQLQQEREVQQSYSVNSSTTPAEEHSFSENEEGHTTSNTQESGQKGQEDEGVVVHWSLNKKPGQQESEVLQPPHSITSTSQAIGESDESASSESEELPQS